MKFLCIVFLCICIGTNVSAQKSDIELLKGASLHKQEDTTFSRYKHISSHRILRLPFLLYKAVFSEQIAATCPYQPSCSEFALLAPKELGLFKAIFMTSDRLMRCNGSAIVEYPKYLHHNDKVSDHPAEYKCAHHRH